MIAKVRATKAALTRAVAAEVPRGACGTPGCTDAECPYGYGICHCGCGGPTAIVKESQRSKNRVAGEPARYIAGHARRVGMFGARDGGSALFAAIALSGLTEPVLARRAGVSDSAVGDLVDRIGYRLSRDRCDRIHTTLAAELETRGERVPTFDELFVDEYVRPENRLQRARPAVPPNKRYDGRHFRTAEHRAKVGALSRQRMGAVRDEVERIKHERHLVDLKEAASLLGLSSEVYVGQLVSKDRLVAERIAVSGSPRTRVLVRLDSVRALRRRWATDPGRLLLDPDKAVAKWEAMGWLDKLMSRKGLSRRQAEHLIRGEVTDRRRLLAAARRGRKPKVGPSELHSEWLDRYHRVRKEQLAEFEMVGRLLGETQPPSRWLAAAAVAEFDFRRHPERWSGYESAGEPGEINPRLVRSAARRVWMALKPLLDAVSEKTTP